MAQARPRLKLRLAPRAEAAVRAGHPWVFADSVREQNRAGDTGELAVLYDRRDAFLGIGLYDPASPLRVRMLHTGKPATLDAAWWLAHFQATVARRDGLFGADTDGWRVINGESDRWPGLVLDRYAGTFVLKLYTAAWLPRLAEITALIRGNLPARALVLRLSRNMTEAAARDFGVREGFLFSDVDPPLETVVFRESGLRFEAEVRHGQKTGFFLDQRENRQRVGEISAGADVLNAFSFSGGFSLHAARGGARSVTDLDISAHALESSRRNFALNADIPAVAAARHETVQADCFQWLESGPRRSFDVIVVDPPSLAKREAERAGAIAAYEGLAASALARLRPRGVLVAASCSAHVSADEFFTAIRRTAGTFGRFDELWTSRHAPDHHATFREAEYLKCLALRLAR